MTEYLYTEDEIIEIGDTLKNLKGKILLDDHKDFFILKDYEIKSITHTEWNGFFKPKKEQLGFYIDSLILSGDEDYEHHDDRMCSMYGVQTLIEYHANYTRLQKNLIKFTLKNGIQLNFGQLTVTK